MRSCTGRWILTTGPPGKSSLSLFFFVCCCLSLSFNTINEVMWKIIKKVFCCLHIFRTGISLMDILFPTPFFFLFSGGMYSRNCLSSLGLF